MFANAPCCLPMFRHCHECTKHWKDKDGWLVETREHKQVISSSWKHVFPVPNCRWCPHHFPRPCSTCSCVLLCLHSHIELHRFLRCASCQECVTLKHLKLRCWRLILIKNVSVCFFSISPPGTLLYDPKHRNSSHWAFKFQAPLTIRGVKYFCGCHGWWGGVDVELTRHDAIPQGLHVYIIGWFPM